MFKHLQAITLFSCLALTAGAQETLVIDKVEMAGISGIRQYWDKPVVVTAAGATRRSDHGHFGEGLVGDWSTAKPGAPVFDAVHRRLLIRFPGAAARIAEAVRQRKSIKKVEIAFEFVDTEYFPMHYRMPSGMSFMGDIWVREQPRWHVVAHVLRKPWKADAKLGPTFNANVNGRCYWAHFGARDSKRDRYPKQFGPTELSSEVTSNRLDITALFTDKTYGKTLGRRLRAFTDNGLILRKWETYDALYNHGGYEYGGAPGHRGIRIKAPKLIITLARRRSKLGKTPAAVNFSKLPASGKATAVMPDKKTFEAYKRKHGVHKPAGMPDWQFKRIRELLSLRQGRELAFPESYDAYGKWVDSYNNTPYRQFTGHHTPVTACEMVVFGKALPAPVLEHMKRYWDGWLMPGKPYYETVHNQFGIWTKPENSYYAKTGDWRGNHSFYRGSYTRFISTMNFNHNAALGAFMGGHLTSNPEALADGRFALETILLRLWAWYDGTTQESIDHYYLGLTLYGQKFFQDLGPTLVDRLMGRSILLKTTDELASCYHPALKRFIASSGRTGVAEMFCINEGVNHIMHLVSKKGALHNIGNKDNFGCPLVGNDLPPDLVARTALLGEWMPLWMGNIVDEKPFPFQMTATFKEWGGHYEKPIWKRSYLMKYSGLATRDITQNETVPVMAQWRRDKGNRAHIQDVGTLLMRFGCNDTEFYDSLYHGGNRSNANGSVGTQGGYIAAMQHKNKAIIMASPFGNLAYHGRQKPAKIHSIQSSIALANYQKSPTWKIYVDKKQVDLSKLPIRVKQKQRITIHDGESYLGIIPIPSTNLGRTAEILITDGGEPVKLQGGGEAAPTLRINNYHYYDQHKPFDEKGADQKKLDQGYGGFIIEMADSSVFKSFKAFQKHIRKAKLTHKWNRAKAQAEVSYKSGGDVMELGFRPEYGGANWRKRVPTDQCFPYRRVNGKWPYLPKGMERDSTLGQQGRIGRLAKNGAVLVHEPGRMAYLLTEPKSGNYLFVNPLPDPQFMVAEAPGGIRVESDGRLGLTNLLINPKTNRIEVRYGLKHGQDSADMASALYVLGMAKTPTVLLNQKTLKPLKTGNAWVIPLGRFNPRKYHNVKAVRERAFKQVAGIPATIRHLNGPGHAILTEPRSGTYSFWLQWPTASPIEVRAPGVRVVTDGSIAVQRIIVSPKDCHILIDYAPYLQVNKADGSPIEDRAKALLVFGMKKAPTVILHGRKYVSKGETVTINGEKAFIIPLFGDRIKDIKNGLTERYRQALKKL